ncbi:MAG: hypothetical protein DRR16_25905 [Candidatus Parabeggiatoa sp. nov. 3]|nr:MAG: hypothetical protein DRR00_10795 [Gammaproteobacteria bacterium]RKZ62532.1 MAG: hypothetical protein DRQ99_18575 [Gammaproteobacteria bacterium]RKZ79339.1 MAG: hypothetical protein DRR16_25905 [Gammaproteobacteria bacterium]
MNRMVGNKNPLPTLQETIMIITDDRLGRTRRGRTRKGRTRRLPLHRVRRGEPLLSPFLK